jgi:hypothetical protein
MNNDVVVTNENLRGSPTADAENWRELNELEYAINNAKGGFKGDFTGTVTRFIHLRKKLGLPLGI